MPNVTLKQTQPPFSRRILNVRAGPLLTAQAIDSVLVTERCLDEAPALPVNQAITSPAQDIIPIEPASEGSQSKYREDEEIQPLMAQPTSFVPIALEEPQSLGKRIPLIVKKRDPLEIAAAARAQSLLEIAEEERLLGLRLTPPEPLTPLIPALEAAGIKRANPAEVHHTPAPQSPHLMVPPPPIAESESEKPQQPLPTVSSSILAVSSRQRTKESRTVRLIKPRLSKLVERAHAQNLAHSTKVEPILVSEPAPLVSATSIPYQHLTTLVDIKDHTAQGGPIETPLAAAIVPPEPAATRPLPQETSVSTSTHPPVTKRIQPLKKTAPPAVKQTRNNLKGARNAFMGMALSYMENLQEVFEPVLFMAKNFHQIAQATLHIFVPLGSSWFLSHWNAEIQLQFWSGSSFSQLLNFMGVFMFCSFVWSLVWLASGNVKGQIQNSLKGFEKMGSQFFEK